MSFHSISLEPRPVAIVFTNKFTHLRRTIDLNQISHPNQQQQQQQQQHSFLIGNGRKQRHIRHQVIELIIVFWLEAIHPFICFRFSKVFPFLKKSKCQFGSIHSTSCRGRATRELTHSNQLMTLRQEPRAKYKSSARLTVKCIS